jgi:hypothetical protein
MSFKLYHCAGKGCLLMLAPEMRQRVQSGSLNATSTFATLRPNGYHYSCCRIAASSC